MAGLIKLPHILGYKFIFTRQILSVPLEPNKSLMHKIMILVILGPLWQIGFSKMVTMSLFYNPGPPKRYQGGPNTLANNIWGQFVKNRGLEDQNGFRTWIWAKMGIFKVLWKAFLTQKPSPSNPRQFMT